MSEKFAKLGMRPANILLPKAGTDMTKWAVVACDQFTSQPEYWEEVDRIAGDAPSTLRLILPESKLNDANVEEHIADINRSMADYLSRDIFQTLKDSVIYIERTQSDGTVRPGLVAAGGDRPAAGPAAGGGEALSPGSPVLPGTDRGDRGAAVRGLCLP